MANTKLTEKLTAVADAIRAKTGNSEKLTLDQMPVEIANIKTQPEEYVTNDINFYDYNGILIFSCSMEDAQNLEKLPTPPEHDGLVFQEWNWTLEQIKNSSVGADVGATYDTEDGAVELDVNIQSTPEKTVQLKISLWTTEDGIPYSTPTVDWGDNSSTTGKSDGSVSFNHTYKNTGKYTIRIKSSSDKCKIHIGTYGGSSNSNLFSSDFKNKNILQSARIGSDCNKLDIYTFISCQNLKTIAVNKNLTMQDGDTFYGCTSLICGIIPAVNTTTSINMFNNCYGLKSISIPPTITEIKSNLVARCRALKRILFPDSVVSIGDTACYLTDSLREILLGSSLKTIGARAFSSANGFSSIIIPVSVTSIGYRCFESCTGVMEYHFKSATPPTLNDSKNIGGNSFIGGDTKIYVPTGCYNTYKIATNWADVSDYYSIIEEG